MINNIIAFSIRNKLIIGLLTIALVATGVWSMTQVPIDAVPDITNNQVQVITQAPSLGTEDIEQLVTYPIELAMANLPGVTELRSVSRSGLSLVTIVFKDDMGIYLPRQLVSEKLADVKTEIPNTIGEPFMGPISTGLGEIYQYTLEVDPEYEYSYSPADLRSMQDWIIRRQMAMVPGVVEVNAFGGETKQYEVAVKPDALKAMNLSIADIYSALEKNNENAGGAYIEKDFQAHFIRGEGLARSLKDIEDIVIKNYGGIPVTIKDVATVQFGKDIRYGAFTKDGKGEAVGGMILMLKGANSNNVIEAVKERVTEIQKSLPEGVSIEPFLDRSKLIAQTTGTVSTNLMEGALIVIFVLVFLLGNWRGGLIVASTIPLSLLFAFILMNVFDVWANLMSLGAIDFGIIIDGAVIIVESTVFLFHDKLLKKKSLNAKDRNKVTLKASSKMMNSAFFGQLIILIVFIPILALEGIEGKMFKPMALTFMFAMIGVMILCLTYVPMMSSWLIRVKNVDKLSLGDKFVRSVERVYEKALNQVLKRSAWIIGLALTLLAIAFFTFSRMGGEFIPKIDEGDIAFHDILKPGTSLSETIKTTSKVEKLIKNNFPEVKHVLSRIGVADVPTDPMPMDIADCFIILKPKEEWKSNETKEELVERIKIKVLEIPGINYEFSQPIEMRFNELITGVREDIAIKIFGDDLAILANKAEEIGQLINGIEGVADMKVEATKGLPQITIKYQRSKIAQYGLSIRELNTTVQSAFAGGKAGTIFEGEKRFDLVVRLDEKYRRSIQDLKNLYINLPNGVQIPLKQVADISYESGPMQISRESTNRRTYVGINVRGRDVKSLVEEIQLKLDSELELPDGYYIRYGGAFENLKRATNRLKIVVPVALGLIFVLIFLALKSIKQATMIYIAIPLAAIGGVFSLWFRDMPFSISAGIGFIVLFGIAVLNGLVLISGWNELKEEGVSNLSERIKRGAKRRIRPILLTAVTDILGFLPMAISSSAGAEVQRPLATVVIGGMISATLLTLFVLPILYQWVERKKTRISNSKPILASLLLMGFCLFSPNEVYAQNQKLNVITNVDTALSIGLKNNGNVKVTSTQLEIERKLKGSSFNLAKTNINVQYGQYNSYQNDLGFNVNQSFEFPSVYTRQNQLAKKQIGQKQAQLSIAKNDLKLQISQVWFELLYLKQKVQLLELQDSIYQDFNRTAQIRYETETSTYLEKLNAETRWMQIKNNKRLLYLDITIQEKQLNILLNDSIEWQFEPFNFDPKMASALMPDNPVAANPALYAKQQLVEVTQAEKRVLSAKTLPDISIGYFNQSFNGSLLESGDVANSSNRFTGIQAGLSIPIFFGSDRAKIRAAKLNQQMAQTQADYYQNLLEGEYESQWQETLKHISSLQYYEETALIQAETIIENAKKSFDNELIDYVEYTKNLDKALAIKHDYLETINDFNQAILRLEYLSGE